MDWLDMIAPLLGKTWEHAKPVEFAQGLLQAGIIWHLVKKSMKEELLKIRSALTEGFALGELRFKGIENRIEKLETKTNS